MYGVVSAVSSVEGRRRRGASATPPAAVTPAAAGAATSLGAMFAEYEVTGEKYRENQAFNAFVGCQNSRELQKRLIA